MMSNNLYDDKSRCLRLCTHSKEIILQKLSYKVYATTSSEDLDIVVDLAKNIIESNSAKHYSLQDDLESSFVILGNICIFVSPWALTIDNDISTKNIKLSSLANTKNIFDKFLHNFNDD